MLPPAFEQVKAQDTGPRGYALIHVETTGLLADRDRVVEIAVVGVDLSGRVVNEWTTLVHPHGPLGATFVHGIPATAVQAAPRFAEIIGETNARLAGRVMVAHNAAFDMLFGRAEYARQVGRSQARLTSDPSTRASSACLSPLHDCYWAVAKNHRITLPVGAMRALPRAAPAVRGLEAAPIV